MDVSPSSRALDELGGAFLSRPTKSATVSHSSRIESKSTAGGPAWSDIPTVAYSAALLLTVLVAGVLMAYALPAESDWTRILREGNGHHDLGWFRYTFGFTYFRWQGRWASCGLESLILPHIDPVRGYPLVLAAIAAVDLLGLYVACREFVRGSSRWLAATMTAGAAALLWAGMPSVAEGVYWSLGAIENVMVLSLAAMLLVAMCAVDLQRIGRRTRPAAFAGFAAVAITICGFHELYGAMLWLVLGTGCVAAGISKNRRARLWTITWIAASAGMAIVLLAPGNAHRLDVDGDPHSRQFFFDVRLAACYLWNYGRAWIFDPKLIAVSLWVAFSPTLEVARTAWPTAEKISWRWAFPALGTAMVSLGFFLPCYAFGNSIPGRTLSGVYIVFVACWLLTLYAWTRRLEQASAPVDGAEFVPVPSSATAVRGAKLLFAASLLMTGNVPMGVRDLKVRVRPWHTMSEQRYLAVEQAAYNNRRVVLTSLPPKPWSLLAGEISDNPHDWHSVAVADYFHLRSVKRASNDTSTTQASISTEPESR